MCRGRIGWQQGRKPAGGVRMGQKYRPNYWKNAALLTGSDVVLRLAGLGLRIGLANALGGEKGWYPKVPPYRP